MGLYSRFIFPRLCELALNTQEVAEQRGRLLAHAAGHVLEIGFGTGLNLAHYPPQVSRLTLLDPNEGMHRLAERRIQAASLPLERHVLRGERLPFAADTFDAVVSTFTLCSIAQVELAMSEVYRVLRPGGTFLFLEHGLSLDPAVQKWQQRLNWLEGLLADGCRLTRDIKGLVAGQPFASIQADEFYLEKTPRTHGYLYRGAARK